MFPFCLEGRFKYEYGVSEANYVFLIMVYYAINQ